MSRRGCRDCGLDMYGRGANARRCEDCAKARRRMLARKRYVENRGARARKLARWRERYASDPEFRRRVLSIRRRRYAEDPGFRRIQLERARESYRVRKREELREVLKDLKERTNGGQ